MRTVKCCSKTLLTLESARKGEAVYYTCHAGLIDAAMPIMVNNQYIGSFLCGEVVLPETKLEFDDIKMRVKDLNLIVSYYLIIFLRLKS